MSHGIPTIFYPYVSYTELAQRYEYYRACGISQDLIHDYYNIVNSSTALSRVLQHITSEEHAHIRRCLSAQGLSIANMFSSRAIGGLLTNTIENLVVNGSSMHLKSNIVTS